MPKISKIQGIVKIILETSSGTGTKIGSYYENSISKEGNPELTIQGLSRAYDIQEQFSVPNPIALFCTYFAIKKSVKKEITKEHLRKEYDELKFKNQEESINPRN
jgi:hypothetical protein